MVISLKQRAPKEHGAPTDIDEGAASGHDFREISLDIAIAIATFIALQLVGVPFWARLLVCFLGDYVRCAYTSLNSRTLLGTAGTKLNAIAQRNAANTRPTLPVSINTTPTANSSSVCDSGNQASAPLDLPTFSKPSPRTARLPGTASKITPTHIVDETIRHPNFRDLRAEESASRTGAADPRRLGTTSPKPEASVSTRAPTESKQSRKQRKKRAHANKKVPESIDTSRVEPLAEMPLSRTPPPTTPAIKNSSSREGEHALTNESTSEHNNTETPGLGKTLPCVDSVNLAPSAQAPASETNTEPARKPTRPKVAFTELLRMGDDVEFEEQMRSFQSRLQESTSTPTERRERRSARLKTVIDPGAFAKLLASKKKRGTRGKAQGF